MSEMKRKIFSGKFKSKVAPEAIRGIKTVNEIGQEYGVHPTQVDLWKKNRKQWVSTNEPLTLARQCELTGINRSTVYAPHMAAKPDEQELKLLELIDTEYTRHPFYGSRKIKIYLRGLGHKINRKHVQRLMRLLELASMAPGSNTSRPHPQYKVYPYLLRGVNVIRPNQVWGADTTYSTPSQRSPLAWG